MLRCLQPRKDGVYLLVEMTPPDNRRKQAEGAEANWRSEMAVISECARETRYLGNTRLVESALHTDRTVATQLRWWNQRPNTSVLSQNFRRTIRNKASLICPPQRQSEFCLLGNQILNGSEESPSLMGTYVNIAVILVHSALFKNFTKMNIYNSTRGHNRSKIKIDIL